MYWLLYAGFSLSSIQHFTSSSWRTCLGYTREEVLFWKQSLLQVPFLSKCFFSFFWLRACSLIFSLFLGYHVKLPFITQFEPIQVTLQTDEASEWPSFPFILWSYVLTPIVCLLIYWSHLLVWITAYLELLKYELKDRYIFYQLILTYKYIHADCCAKPGQRYSLWNKRWCHDQLWQDRGINIVSTINYISVPHNLFVCFWVG